MLSTVRQLIEQLTGLAAHEIHIRERSRLDYQSHDLYDVRFGDSHWIAKVFTKENEYDDGPKREYEALKLLEPFDLAPLPIHYSPYNPPTPPIVIYDYMAGTMWEDKPTLAQLTHLAEAWLHTHQAPTEGIWLSRGWDETRAVKKQRWQWFYTLYFDWAAQHYPQGQVPARRLFDLHTQYSNILDQQQAIPLLFSRSDPRFANIIQRPDGRIGFVDWEDSGLRDPARTLGDFIMHPDNEDQLTEEAWQHFLNIYLAGYPIDDPTLTQRIQAYRFERAWVWFGGQLAGGVRRLQQGNTLVDWQINGMAANQRLRRYAAHALSGDTPQLFDDYLAELSAISFFPQ